MACRLLDYTLQPIIPAPRAAPPSVSSTSPQDELAGTEQPFVSHLIELRDRLLWAVYGVGAIFALLCLYPGPSHLYDLLAQPLVKALPQGSKMIAVGVVSPFLIPIKVTALAAFGVALPWVLYQVWAFVAPGLYKHEKRLVMPLVVTSTLLFYTGVAFCYFFVFGQAFPAIQAMAPQSVSVSPDIEAYLDFVITMFLAFGVAFEVPIAVIILARLCDDRPAAQLPALFLGCRRRPGRPGNASGRGVHDRPAGPHGHALRGRHPGGRLLHPLQQEA
jgi:sec-independent protein translocase protein TatC